MTSLLYSCKTLGSQKLISSKKGRVCYTFSGGSIISQTGGHQPLCLECKTLFNKSFIKTYMKVKVIIAKCSTGLQTLKLWETRRYFKRYTNRPLPRVHSCQGSVRTVRERGSALFGGVVLGLFRNSPWEQNDRHTWLKTFSIPVISLSDGNKFK